MCGRFTLILEPNELQADLQLGDIPSDLASRYNIAPTQPVAVVADATTRNVELFRWGLIPSWAKDISIGSRLINARSETLEEKPSFKTAFTRRRCLILADGFYEWHRKMGRGEKSQPYFFRLENGEPFAFAGLWDTWHSPEGESINSCTLITCSANDLVGRIHDRMPVILDSASIWDWMDPTGHLPALKSLLRAYPAEKMVCWPVSPQINNASIEGADLTKPSGQMGFE